MSKPLNIRFLVLLTMTLAFFAGSWFAAQFASADSFAGFWCALVSAAGLILSILSLLGAGFAWLDAQED